MTARLQGRLAALIGTMVIAFTVIATGGPVLAQTGGYPPGSSVPSCTPGNVTISTPVGVGQTVTLTLCGGFADGATVSLKVNGSSVTTTKSPVNGAVTVVIQVISQTQLQVNDPVTAPANCGTNTVTATGSGTPGTSTGTFTLTCSSTTTAAGSTTTTRSSLPLTGARILEALFVALALIAIGTVLVMVQRRRRQHTAW
ncbi:MAG: hypothetical protein ACRDZ8_16680 [Acidimicrobiales bacterium]